MAVSIDGAGGVVAIASRIGASDPVDSIVKLAR
jgi:hypothetical protein